MFVGVWLGLFRCGAVGKGLVREIYGLVDRATVWHVGVWSGPAGRGKGYIWRGEVGSGKVGFVLAGFVMAG